MADLKYTYTPYINDVVFEELLDRASSANFSKAGGNSKCAIINNYAVLKTSNIPGHDDSFARMIETLKSLKENDVNVIPILGYGIAKFGESYYNGARYDKGYIVQEKAPGQELLYLGALRDKTEEEKHDIVLNYLQTVSSIPQSHYDKWVSDYKAITDAKVMVDPSKASNFFYDSEKGFSFIDLNFFTQEPLFDKVDHQGNQHHAEFILYSLTPFKSFLNENSYFHKYLQTPEELAFAEQVAVSSYEKNFQALQQLGVTQEDMDYTLETFNIELPKALQKPEIQPSVVVDATQN